jgi:protein gp37
MALCPQHTFQALTKRPERMRGYLDLTTDNREEAIGREVLKMSDGRHSGLLELPLPNVWLGVSVENQAAADERIPVLLRTPAAVRFVSVEPLLGPMDLGAAGGLPVYWEAATVRENMMGQREDGSLGIISSSDREGRGWCRHDGNIHPWLDLVIVGGESGSGARPMHPDWVRSIRDQCQAAGVAFFFKGWGRFAPADSGNYAPGSVWVDPQGRIVTERLIRDVKAAQGTTEPWVAMQPLPKRLAGEVLDGREWKEFCAVGGEGIAV